MSVLKYLSYRQFSNADAFWLLPSGYFLFSGHPFFAVCFGVVCAAVSVVFEAAVEVVQSEKDA